MKKLDKKKRTAKLLVRIIGFVVLFLAVVYAGARIMMYSGMVRLKNQANTKAPELVMEDVGESKQTQTQQQEPEQGYEWKDGWVRYQGEIYAYNEDILTFLVMGIDKEGTVKESTGVANGGQSDAIFLLIVNPHEMSLSILAIDRNTMADINMVGIGDGGADIAATAQLALQHGFGDGGKQSCELTREAVSALLYNLPIHGYISVNYGAIPQINDAVGGIEVTITEDAAGAKKSWNAGDTVLLQGKDAIRFVKWRDTSLYESARLRTQRQKTYLTAFVAKAMDATKQDITMPLTLYNKVKNYTVTDISVDEMTYLASELIGYQFSGERIYTMTGETVVGDKYEEFYPDMDALKEQMIEIFYEKVSEAE